MLTRSLTLALLATLAASAACSGGPSDAGTGGSAPGLRITAGDQVTDSIDAVPVQSLVVEVTAPTGKPAAGAAVQFEALLVGTDANQTATMWVAPVGTSDFGWIAGATTDATGHATIRLRMGTRAGAGGVRVSVPVYGYARTAAYTIQAGAPFRVTATPQDTTLYVGRTATVRTTVADRAGNPRSDAVTLSLAPGPASLAAGGIVTATAIGRAAVIAQAGAAADTSYFSVVPEGTIAGYTPDMELYRVNLDGTGMTLLATASAGRGYFGEMPAAWSADGSSLVYHDSQSDHNRVLYSINLASGARTRLVTAPDGLVSEAWPQRSRDGQWVYFNGQGSWQGSNVGSTLFRIRSDGTGLEKINPGGTYAVSGYASPSPDGSRVAFLTNRDFSVGGLHVLDLASGQNTALHLPAATPRWSPNGDLIAYVAIPEGFGFLDNHYLASYGELRVVRPDGTGDRRVTGSVNYFLGGIDWSPDGKYLIGSGQQGAALTVVEVATGAEVPVRLPRILRAPAWRP